MFWMGCSPDNATNVNWLHPLSDIVGGLIDAGLSLDWLHVRFSNTNGTATGLAVQNMGNTNTSYSGMLFYDQFGAAAIQRGCHVDQPDADGQAEAE